MALDTRNVEQMLAELRSSASVVQGKPAAPAAQAPGGVDFGQALKTAIDQVNSVQEQAQQMAEGFASEKSDVSLHDVMINLQKANLSFQQMVQVRNKLVSAYQDIMNMQV